MGIANPCRIVLVLSLRVKECFLRVKDSKFGVLQSSAPRRYTYYWTVPLILDHSYLVKKSKSSKIADTKVSGF